jgi:hypothetical protein
VQVQLAPARFVIVTPSITPTTGQRIRVYGYNEVDL